MESKLVVALDLMKEDDLLGIAAKIGSQVFAIKLNWPAILVSGSRIIREVSRYSRVICDFKVADIPNTNSLITEKALEMGAWGIISHSFTGYDSLRAVIEHAGDMSVFSVVSMSHPGSAEFINPNTDRLIEMSVRAGAAGFIAPGNNPEEISRIRKMAPEKIIMTPGVGAQGGKAGDAVRAGADLVIVGRSVYASNDPEKQVEIFNSEINSSV
ncbi:MAG: orotidine-5'-phosphate decarboxylase [Thermoplasmataceae archaeon]